MTSLSFTVVGTPSPQGSKNGFTHPHTGRVIITDKNPKHLKTWRANVRQAALSAITHSRGLTYPLAGPVHVTLIFRMPRPKAHYRTGRHAHLLRDAAPTWVDRKPDIDKLVRSTLDALTEALAYRDDNQVVSLAVEQRYACTHDHPHQHPGVHVELWSLQQPARATAPGEQGVLL